MSSDKKKLTELEKLKQRMAQDRKKLRAIETKELNRKNAVIVEAIAKALEGGRLMKNQYADILDHYVTDDKDRQLLKLPPKEAETVTNSDESNSPTLETVQHQDHNGHQHEYSFTTL